MRELDALFRALPDDEKAVIADLVHAAALRALEATEAEGWSGPVPAYLAGLSLDVAPAIFRALESRGLAPVEGPGADVPPVLGAELMFGWEAP
jgi:hypothetical protein